MSASSEEFLKNAITELGICPDEKQIRHFLQYYEYLVEINSVMNLTAITEFEEVVKKHFVDSLMLSRYIGMENIHSMIDVGTGAGFPGVPLKIMYPHLNICLMDSLGKRIQFLKDLCEKLGLKDVDFVHSRAEDLAHQPAYREQFDLCTSRAVSKMSVLCEYCLPFVKKGGYFVSYKAGNIGEELNEARNAITVLGGSVDRVPEFVIPGTDMSRSLVFIEKKAPTKPKYPRKAGVPQKQPL